MTTPSETPAATRPTADSIKWESKDVVYWRKLVADLLKPAAASLSETPAPACTCGNASWTCPVHTYQPTPSRPEGSATPMLDQMNIDAALARVKADPQAFDWTTLALAAALQSSRETVARTQRALDATNIAGIFDIFTDPADAIEQMALHIRDLTERAEAAERELAALKSSVACLHIVTPKSVTPSPASSSRKEPA